MLHRCKMYTFYIYGPLGRKVLCQILKSCYINWITSLNIQKLQIFAIFASYLASIVIKPGFITLYLPTLIDFSLVSLNIKICLYSTRLCAL